MSTKMEIECARRPTSLIPQLSSLLIPQRRRGRESKEERLERWTIDGLVSWHSIYISNMFKLGKKLGDCKRHKMAAHTCMASDFQTWLNRTGPRGCTPWRHLHLAAMGATGQMARLGIVGLFFGLKWADVASQRPNHALFPTCAFFSAIFGRLFMIHQCV
jgi:hypothetical protein